MAPGAFVDDEEIELWLTQRIVRVRQYLLGQGSRTPKPCFELWTSGRLSGEAQARIEKTRNANASKFDLRVIGPEALRGEAKAVHDPSLLKVLEQHFIPEKSGRGIPQFGHQSQGVST